MKKIIGILISLLCSLAAFSQTPEEILDRMEKVIDQHQNDGVYMIIDLKLPIVGTLSTKTWVYGEKMRAVAKVAGVEVTTWLDETTQWVYNAKNNELEITNRKEESSSTDGDIDMFVGLTEGYDLSVKDQTDKTWHILCKKSKSNKNKGDPKTIDIVVEKDTYNPRSLSTKMDGITFTMRDLSFNVTEKQVLFNPKDYADATIIDKR